MASRSISNSSTSDVADIMETDDKMIGSLFVSLIFVAATGFLINLVASYTTVFSESGLTNATLQIGIGIGFVFVASLFANFKAMDFVQDHIKGIIIWFFRILVSSIVLALWSLAIYVAFFVESQNYAFGALLFIVGTAIGGVAYYIREWLEQKARKAAEWIQVSATIVLNEPGMIIISFIQSLVIGIALITGFFSIFGWLNYSEQAQISGELSSTVFFLIIFLYLWLSLAILYYFDGVNTFVAYARIHGKDPKIGQGVNVSTKRIPSIIGYALISAIVASIVFILNIIAEGASGDESDSIAAAIIGSIFRLLAGLVAYLYHLFSFFTLPFIIIHQKTTREAMGSSKNTFDQNPWDVIVSDTGYSFASAVIYVVTGIFLGVLGFLYGTLVVNPVANDPNTNWGVTFGVMTLIVGFFITKFFLRPLWSSLVTTIFVYATEGPQVLTNLSGGLVEHIKEVENSDKYQEAKYASPY